MDSPLTQESRAASFGGPKATTPSTDYDPRYPMIHTSPLLKGKSGNGESKPVTNRTDGVNPPLAHIAIPTGLHFADEHDFLALNINRSAEEVTRVRAAFQDGLSRSGT